MEHLLVLAVERNREKLGPPMTPLEAEELANKLFQSDDE